MIIINGCGIYLLRKDVNTRLLGLIMVLIIAFTSVTAYYKFKLDSISAEYSRNLEQITGRMALQQQNQTFVIKETSEQDKEVLEQGYSELKFDNERLRTENSRIEGELASAKSQLEESQNKFSLLESRFRQVQDSLSKANDGISRLTAKNRGLCSKVRGYNAEEEC